MERPEVKSSRVVYENHWMRLREDELVWPDGSPGIYAVVEKPLAAVIAAVDGDHVYLVEQHRYTVDQVFLELPQGALDGDQATEDGQAVAATELAEETGLTATTWRRLGRMYFAYGLSNQPFESWLATDLAEGEQRLEPSETGLRVHRVPVAELPELIASGRIADAATVATLSLAGLVGG